MSKPIDFQRNQRHAGSPAPEPPPSPPDRHIQGEERPRNISEQPPLNPLPMGTEKKKRQHILETLLSTNPFTLNHAKDSNYVRESSKKLANLELKWEPGPPKNVLLIKKYRDMEVNTKAQELICWLIRDMKLIVHLEHTVLDDESFLLPELLEEELGDKVKIWDFGGSSDNHGDSSSTGLISGTDESIDFVIILGGDGTVLHVTSLFQENVPPILSFNLGSLGFLTVFDYKDHKEVIKDVVSGAAKIVLRMRLQCEYTWRPERRESDGNVADAPLLLTENDYNSKRTFTEDPAINDRNNETTDSDSDSTDSALLYREDNEDVINIRDIQELLQHSHKTQSMNEIVIERGTSPYMTSLIIYVDNQRVTTVHADGLIISTPTGSTAYSLSAGGPIVHPSVPGILITPICPHTLSFRPLFLPDSAVVVIYNPKSSRQNAWISIDGKWPRHLMVQGEGVRIKASEWPVATICHTNPSKDLFNSLARCLNWNVRDPQKPFSYTSKPVDPQKETLRRKLSQQRLARTVSSN